MTKTSETTIGDLIQFQRGYDLPKSQFVEGKVPVISSNGILGYHDTYKVEGPGITIGRSGTVGLPHYIKANFFPHNTSLFIKDFKGNDVKYIFYLLKNLGLDSRKSGSGVPTMNRNHLHPLKILAHCSVEDQKKIAAVLSALDAKIDLNHRINRELEGMAKLLYDYWFVQFDFPNAAGQPYKSSGGEMVFDEVLGREIPKGWESRKLDSLVSYNKWTLKRDDSRTDINYLDTSNLTNNEIGSVQSLKTEEDKIPSRAKRVVSKNDILYSTVRPNQQHFGIIKHQMDNLIASTGFVQIRSNNALVSNDLLFRFLTTKGNIKRAHQIAELSVSSYPSISPTDLLDFELVLPKDLSILKKWAGVFDKLHLKISKNHQENRRLATLRDWLLPMLMNGQVGVGE